MTTGPSSAQPNETAIPFPEPADLTDRVESRSGDPVGELVRAAVADRPLDDIAHLITLLERSPEYADATVAALRAVGVNRSVEDVTKLVVLLTRPPRDVASADEAIRAAAESRPLEEVTRLLSLLHRTPLEPHCGEEAVRAAAAGRPVEELVDLIGRLAEERQALMAPPGFPPPPDGAPASMGAADGTFLVGAVPVRDLAPASRSDAAPRYRSPRGAGRQPFRPARLAVLALLVCGVLSFPLHRDGASVRVYGFALGVSVLCVLLALVLAVRSTVPTLAAAVVVPAAMAAGQLFEGKLVHSAGLSRALDLALAPAWIAGAVAVCASLAALTALFARLAWQPPRQARVQPMAEAGRAPVE
ncbi:hypothetical protein [Streptomyces lincolnensis]|nr:hypothetical protein [Streptomyces lincolnensis]